MNPAEKIRRAIDGRADWEWDDIAEMGRFSYGGIRAFLRWSDAYNNFTVRVDHDGHDISLNRFGNTWREAKQARDAIEKYANKSFITRNSKHWSNIVGRP